MAEEVTWAEEAIEELDEIARYIAEDSVDAAMDVVTRIRAAAIELLRFPNMGPVVPEWNQQDFRQRILYSYRLIYHVLPDRIEVIAVWHGARLLSSSVRRRRWRPK